MDKCKRACLPATKKKKFLKMRPRTTKEKNKKTVNSSAFHSGDTNFHGGQFRTDTEDKSTVPNNTLPSCGLMCKLKVSAINYLCIGLTVLCSEIPHERQAVNRYLQA